MEHCETCNVPEGKRQCQRIIELDADTCRLEIKPEALARLIQTQQLTINDFACTDNYTKQFVQAVMLNCIVCGSGAKNEVSKAVTIGGLKAK